MFKQLHKKFPFIAAIVLLIGLNLAFVWSLNHMSHNMHTSSPMIGCLMLMEDSFCPMNLLDHIREWKGVTVMTENISWQQLLVLIAFTTLFTLFQRYRSVSGQISPGQRFIQKIRELSIRCWSDVSRLFSQGLLHPKIFPKVV